MLKPNFKDSICRICLEESDLAEMISPCLCKGTSLLIHVKCLESWQIQSMKRHMYFNALCCPVCKSFYSYPSLIWQLYRFLYFVWISQLSRWLDWLSRVVSSLISLIRVSIYMFLIVVVVTFNSQLQLFNNRALSVIKNNGTLQLAFIYSIDSTQSNCRLVPGVLLSASHRLQNILLFHSSNILIFEHSVKRTRGLILNHHAVQSCTNIRGQRHEYRYGGPVSASTKLFLVTNNLNRFDLTHCRKMYKIDYKNPDSQLIELFVCEFEECTWLASFLSSPDGGSSMTIGSNRSISRSNYRESSTENEGRCVSDPNKHGEDRNETLVWLFRGCVSWLPNQLEGELVAGLWTMATT